MKYRLGKKLEGDVYGDSYLCLNIDQPGQLCIMRKIKLEDEAERNEAILKLEEEINVLSKLNHDNIVKFVGCQRAAGYLDIFTEYAGSAGTLRSFIKEFGNFDECIIQEYTKQILSCTQFLHSKGFSNLNIKCENLLICTSGKN